MAAEMIRSRPPPRSLPRHAPCEKHPSSAESCPNYLEVFSTICTEPQHSSSSKRPDVHIHGAIDGNIVMRRAPRVAPTVLRRAQDAGRSLSDERSSDPPAIRETRKSRSALRSPGRPVLCRPCDGEHSELLHVRDLRITLDTQVHRPTGVGAQVAPADHRHAGSEPERDEVMEAERLFVGRLFWQREHVDRGSDGRAQQVDEDAEHDGVRRGLDDPRTRRTPARKQPSPSHAPCSVRSVRCSTCRRGPRATCPTSRQIRGRIR